jgi:hypothetical protein
MRWVKPLLSVTGLITLAACAAATPHIVSQTPGGVQIECVSAGPTGCTSPQAVADMAQSHCQRYGLDAQQRSIQQSAAGDIWASYVCVPAVGHPTVPQPNRQ